MSLIEDFKWRHAVKAFDPTKKVSQDKIDKIVEAARLAPTSSGLQPFKVFVIKNQHIKEKLDAGALNVDCMKDCSHVLVFASWDNYTPQRIDMMYDLTTDMRGLPRGRFSRYTDSLKEKFGNQSPEQNFAHIARQTYIGLGFALAEAAKLRVDTCPIEGFENQLIDNVLELEKHNLKSLALLYIGVADPQRDWVAQMTKVRLPKEDFVVELK